MVHISVNVNIVRQQILAFIFEYFKMHWNCGTHWGTEVYVLLDTFEHTSVFSLRLNSIKLFGIVKKKILDKYSFNDVLQPFFEDIRQLSTGVYFLIGEMRTKCYGKVLLC